MHFTHPVSDRVADHRAHEGLGKCAIERKVYLGNSRGRCKTTLIRQHRCRRARGCRPAFVLRTASPSFRARDRGWRFPRSCPRKPPHRGRAAAYRSGRYCLRTHRALSSRRPQKRKCRDARRFHGSYRRWSARTTGCHRRCRRGRESNRALAAAGVMLSPFEQNTTIGERILRRSIVAPSDVLMRPAARLLPTNSSSTMN